VQSLFFVVAFWLIPTGTPALVNYIASTISPAALLYVFAAGYL
jgi:hypothetical protein